MAVDRYVVLGHAPVRSTWFRELARWSTSASLPIELVKAISIAEVRVRLQSGRVHSALLIDAAGGGLDRDLVDLAVTRGVPVLAVDDAPSAQRWLDLGAAAVLAPTFDQSELVRVLASVAAPVPAPRGDVVGHVEPELHDGSGGRLITVTGAPGAGRSTVAIGVAQGLGALPGDHPPVCLADLALRADQAMLHDSADVVPGLLDLLEAHRFGSPPPGEVVGLTWEVAARHYRLLLGLRRHREWTAIRPRTLGAGLDALRRAFGVVVADVDGDLEGEATTGSADIQDRNALTRAAVDAADLVIVVGLPTLHGIHGLVRSILDLLDHGVPGERLVPVVNRAPRSPRSRGELSRSLAALVGPAARTAGLPAPLFVGERRQLDALLRARAALPPSWCAPLVSSVRALLATTSTNVGTRHEAEPIAIAPGSLGAWSELDATSDRAAGAW